MTGDVDFDRLADFVGGALDGTRAEHEVRDLVASDPAWAAAHARLLAANDAVCADLAVFASTSERMPADVAAGLDAALASMVSGLRADARTGPAETGPKIPDWRGSDRDTAGRGTRGRPPGMDRARQTRPTTTRTRSDTNQAGLGPGRKHHRWRILSAAVAAVAVLGIGGAVGISALRRDSGPQSTAGLSGAKANGPEAAPGNLSTRSGDRNAEDGKAASGSGRSTLVQVASGRDYTVSSLSSLNTLAAAPDYASQQTGNPVPKNESAGGQQRAPEALARLTRPATLDQCLAAITRRYGGSITLVDFARFEGRPAVAALLADVPGSAGRPWAVVVGAGCGADGTIGDLRHAGPI